MAVVSLESAKGCGSADSQSIGRCDGGCLLFPVVPLSAFLLIVLLFFPSSVTAQEQCTDIVGNGVFDPIEQYIGGTLTVSETVMLVYDVYSLVLDPGTYAVSQGVRYMLGDDEYPFRVCSGSSGVSAPPWDELTFHAVVFFGILCSGFLAVMVVRR